MRSLPVGVLLCLLLLAARPADAEETARCPRCEHRWVTKLDGERARGRSKERCRVCREQAARLGAGYLAHRHEMAGTEEERRTLESEWQAMRDDLRSFGYALGDFREGKAPRLLPLRTEEDLALALFDEAQRLRRRSTWSRDMATELRKGRGTWGRVVRHEGSDRKLASWVYEDRIRAWTERAALYKTLADRYHAQARDLTVDALAGALDVAETDPAPEARPTAGSMTAMIDEVRVALRELLVLERRAFEGLLAWTRGADGAKLPTTAERERMEELQGDAFSTADLANIHRTRVREIDLLRSNVLTDADTAPFFERAPVLAEALKRLGPGSER